MGHPSAPSAPPWRLVPPAALAGAMLGLVGGFFLGRGTLPAGSPDIPSQPSLDPQTAARMEEYRAEVDRWKAAADAAPDDPEPPRHVGDLYFDLRFYDRAVPWYERSLAIADDPEVQNDLGFTQFLSGDEEAALATLRDLVATWPGHARGWLALGVVLLHGGGDAREAADAFAEAARLDPDGPVGGEATRFIESMAESA